MCTLCGREDIHRYGGDAAPAPEHCSNPMSPGSLRFPDTGNPQDRRLHVVALQDKPKVSWSSGRADYPNVFELWQLAPGRAKGERLGWIGCRESEILDPITGMAKMIVEFKLPTGVTYRDVFGDQKTGGFAADVEHAAAFMVEALEGGVHSGKYVDAIQSEIAS